MAYEIIVLDVDGTLVNSNKELTEKRKRACIDIQESGCKVVIASGRSPAGIKSVAKEIRLDEYGGYILSYNGGQILNCKTGEIIFDKTLSNDLIPEIYHSSKEYRTGIMTYYNDAIVSAGKADEYIQLDSKACEIDIIETDDFVDYLKKPVNKCLLTGNPEGMALVETKMKERFKDRLTIYRSENFFVEVMPLGVDKGYGLSHLLDHLGLSRKQMICVGDSYNDISMIKYAGLGVAMGNAKEEVKENASFITSSCDEDGVAYVIKKFME